MKYTEFETKVKELDSSLVVEFEGVYLWIKGKEGMIFATVGIEHIDIADTSWVEFMVFENNHELFVLVFELAKTPLEEREEEKKYRYFLSHLPKQSSWLNYSYSIERFFYSDKVNDNNYKTIFTEKEYAELAKRKGVKEGIHEKEEVR